MTLNPNKMIFQEGESRKYEALDGFKEFSKLESTEVDWLCELEIFASDFAQFERRINTDVSQSAFGIGPVQYNICFDGSKGIAEEKTSRLDRLVELEQLLGNKSIQFEAGLLSAIFGKEDPVSWLPASQRVRIRSTGREITARRVDRYYLAQFKAAPSDLLTEYIRACDNLPTLPNEAETAIVIAATPRNQDNFVQLGREAELLYPCLTPENIRLTLIKRRKRRDYNLKNRRFVFNLLSKGIMKRLTSNTEYGKSSALDSEYSVGETSEKNGLNQMRVDKMNDLVKDLARKVWQR